MLWVPLTPAEPFAAIHESHGTDAALRRMATIEDLGPVEEAKHICQDQLPISMCLPSSVLNI